MALGKFVAEIDGQMTYRELLAWQKFYALEPFGDERADYRAGIIASTVLLPHLKKGAKPPQPIDFMHFVDPGAKKKAKARGMMAELKAKTQPKAKAKEPR